MEQNQTGFDELKLKLATALATAEAEIKLLNSAVDELIAENYKLKNN
ncbi:hypothetical protein [Campylobacter pinnipediorum]|nr:hypothetical protein [Campylobacter pinnipediorum]